MMKNTEWGAVSYLQHSVYGSHTSVGINNNSNYITGYAAKEGVTTAESAVLGKDGTNTYNYKNPLSVSASTTNNYSGVYDMSGGALEYVMGVVMDSNGVPTSGASSSGNSGFNGPYSNASGRYTSGIDFPDEKYYDKYVRGVNTEFNHRILGDATGEMGPFANRISSWYQDEAWFACITHPWFERGGRYNDGDGSGIYFFGYGTGVAYADHTYRIVLAF